MTLDIAIDADAEWDSSNDWARLARSAAAAAIAESAFPQLGQGERMVELSVRLASDEQVHALNAEWRGKDKPTNVLSFPAFPVTPGKVPGPMLGDIIIARETVEREAIELEKSFDDHLTHLIVHGFLHLFGYDHNNDAEAEIMEGLETRILAVLGLSDPYEGQDLKMEP